MATVILHLDEETLERARQEASRRGTSVEQVAEERVRELAAAPRMSQAEAVRQLMEFSEKHPMRFPNGIPSRDEMHER